MKGSCPMYIIHIALSLPLTQIRAFGHYGIIKEENTAIYVLKKNQKARLFIKNKNYFTHSF